MVDGYRSRMVSGVNSSRLARIVNFPGAGQSHLGQGHAAVAARARHDGRHERVAVVGQPVAIIGSVRLVLAVRAGQPGGLLGARTRRRQAGRETGQRQASPARGSRTRQLRLAGCRRSAYTARARWTQRSWSLLNFS
jgi:hypothetical protein